MLLCYPPLTPRRTALKAPQSFVRTISSRGHGVRHSPRLVKGYATSATSNGKITKDAKGLNTVKSEPLTLLHKTTQLLPRVLELNTISGFSRIGETAKTWEDILSQAYEDLSATSERPAKIVVCGLDEWSGMQELVTALLADPLSSGVQTEALEDRWKGRTEEGKVSILHGTSSDPGPSSFQVPSSYLTHFPIPIEITELRPPTTSTSDNLTSILNNPAVLEADIPILVCNPITVSLSELLNARIPSNALVILTAIIAPAEMQNIIQKQSRYYTANRIPEVVSVDPRLAIEAIRALQAEPHSISAIQKYQRDFVGSRLSNITTVLQSKLTAKPYVPTIRANLALGRISEALHYSIHSVQLARHETDKAFIDVSRLEEAVREAQTRAAKDVFGQRDPSADKVILNEVDEALKQAEKEMRQVMDTLTWWRMLWRVDEISGTISSALRQSWCHELEKKLIMQTGKLTVLQENLSQSGFTLLRKHPAISTAVLQNTLLQLKASPQYHLTPDSLTKPLYSRRNQIIEFPTTRLHVTGQRAVLGMYGGILSGAGVSWAGWLGWLLGSGEGLLGLFGMDARTAIGVGMLGVVASVRWAVGQWEKSKKQWWQDWARAAEGLDRDLKDTLSKTMQDQVVVVAETSFGEMTKLVRTREQELAKVGTEIESLQAAVEDVPHRVDKS